MGLVEFAKEGGFSAFIFLSVSINTLAHFGVDVNNYFHQ